MISYLQEIWANKELRLKIIFVIAILTFIRLLAHIPLPQIDRTELANFLNKSENQVFGVLSLFTGGSLANLSIQMLGVGPYITASIIVQLLTKAIPAWEEISKEGSAGREKLNQYSRYLTVPLSIIQGYGTIILLKSQNVIVNATTADIIKMIITISATSIFVMWLGEIISEKGVGNGLSLIIALGIVAGLPTQVANYFSIFEGTSYFNLFIFLAMALITVTVIVAVNEAMRKIPITYARRQSGSGSLVDSFLPLKINTAGVIPIIFALSFLTFPAIIARFLTTANSSAVVDFGNKITAWLSNNFIYGLIYFFLVFAFTYFYTYIVFEPKQVAENLQKQGSFIPGVRPGTETINFISYTLLRITTIGAIFLALVAVLPLISQKLSGSSILAIGGTGVLIVVSVVIETARQISSQVTMRRYDAVNQ